ncbi:hypothetical protein [Halorhabdus sp. CUG00001]|uniref:hypothetical protein n=1 Tax=Halorhabdus sp. CUG00001 TaxID=2600297 RepID=UPI00131E2C72|nr:hypothetical protein [Halorhabdus sp. CUG00001]
MIEPWSATVGTAIATVAASGLIIRWYLRKQAVGGGLYPFPLADLLPTLDDDSNMGDRR